MQSYTTDSIRNVVLLSHSGAGKTSLGEAMLFHTKAITKLGRVEDGNTISDYEPEEIKRGVSINLSILPCEWQGNKINLIDTPGYADFVSELKSGIEVAEGAVIVICAASGVEVGTESAWRYAEERELPRIIFVNKMDRENADFYRTLGQINQLFGKKCFPIQLPIGTAAGFQGIVDLTSEGDIPEAIKSDFLSFKEKLLEIIAETDDALTIKYLEGEEITPEEIKGTLKEGVKSGKLVPILVGSAWQGQSVAELLEAIVSYLPSPNEAKPIAILNSAGETEVIQPEVEAPLATLVFKTTADPYIGKLTYLRVYSGIIHSNSQIWNVNKSQPERIGQLFSIRGKNQQPVSSVIAGDFGAVAKLALTNTGDTLGDKEHPLVLPSIEFPKPIFSVALYPKTKQDVDKLGTILPRILEEDSTLEMTREPDTGETLLSGMGDTHVEVAVERMQRKFGLEVTVTTPKVPYKETVLVSTKAEYKHKKQSGGHGQYGHVFLELEPLPRGGGFEFADRIVGGAISKKYVAAVEKGVIEALQEGVLAKYPVTDLKVSLYHGSEHPVDSSDISFKIAGAQAVKKGLSQAQPVLLEPIMYLTVTVPETFTGDIIGDLNTKRAKVLGMSPEDGKQVVEAYVPLAEILRYTIDLRSITQGQGSYTAEFSHYEEVPPHLNQKIIEQMASEK